MNAIEDWEKLFMKYRFTEMAVLYAEAIRIGLQNGSVTAEDLHHIPVVNTNVRGAVMKGLRRGGLFEKVSLAFGSTQQSHGHTMFVWRLVSVQDAKRILRFYTEKVSGLHGLKPTGQMELNV